MQNNYLLPRINISLVLLLHDDVLDAHLVRSVPAALLTREDEHVAELDGRRIVGAGETQLRDESRQDLHFAQHFVAAILAFRLGLGERGDKQWKRVSGVSGEESPEVLIVCGFCGVVRLNKYT